MANANLRAIVVGDGGVGKSCFIISWTAGVFPSGYVPTVFDNRVGDVVVDGESVGVLFWDTPGQEDYSHMRPLSYPGTDIFLVCFAVNSPTSFDNIKSKWVPEIRRYCPDTPIALLGMKADLRFSGYYVQSGDNIQPGSDEPGAKVMVDTTATEHMAREIGAIGYFETSALTCHGLSEAMTAAIRAVFAARRSGPSQKKFTWPWKRHSKSKGDDAASEIPHPPELPPNEKSPWINIPSSRFSQDWAKLINNQLHSDVTFTLDKQTFYAHKYVLCCASEVFRRLFGVEEVGGVSSESLAMDKNLTKCSGWSSDQLKNVSVTSVNAGQVEGFHSIKESADDSGRATIEISLDSTLLKELAFQCCLEFLYTGYVELKGDSEGLDDTLKAAKVFNLPELQMIIENAQIGDEHLSPSIGTWLNDRNCATAKNLFLNKSLFSDVTFNVDGALVHSHKLVLCTRSEVMATMFASRFKESQTNTVDIPEVGLDTFLAFLEYLYTDHSPIEDCTDSVGILDLSNRYVLPRLTSLCELYIAKHVERATAESIAQAEVDIMGLLLTSELHSASQLSAWCLHFISSNYVIFKDKEGFSKLTGENLEYINEHRWPPLSYEQAMEEYRSKYLAEEDERHDLGGKAEASTGGDQADSDHDTGKLDNCTIS